MFERTYAAMTRQSVRAGSRVVGRTLEPMLEKRRPPPGSGDWIAGVAMSLAGARRFKLYRPAGVSFGERLPLMVMLHGCGQDAKSFANTTRMNRVATRERFLVLYPEQDGAADPVVSINNGHAAVQAWAHAAGARASKSRNVQRGRRHATRVTDFKRRATTQATLVEVAHLRHAWSGGASGQPFSDEQGPDASRLLWAFALRQFRGITS